MFVKRIKLDVFWMPSHLYDDPDKERKSETPAYVQQMHILGNHHADRLAGVAASYYDIHKHVTEPIIWDSLWDRNGTFQENGVCLGASFRVGDSFVQI